MVLGTRVRKEKQIGGQKTTRHLFKSRFRLEILYRCFQENLQGTVPHDTHLVEYQGKELGSNMNWINNKESLE
jgi:hypothetical protein